MEINSIVSNKINRNLSDGMDRANNVDYQFVAANYLLTRKPDAYVYLYNVSEQEFKVSRPPILREMRIPARDYGKRYKLITSLPIPLLTPKPNVDAQEYDVVALDTRRFAMDIVNPDNTSLNQDMPVDPKEHISEGNNLGALGLFWSMNNPPSDTEVEAAIRRMEKRYRNLIDEADALQLSAPAQVSQLLTPSHHLAAEYFAEAHDWHKVSRRKDELTDECPNCFTKIKKGAAFHKTDEGILCIIDWPRAIKAGVRTKQQAIDAGIEGFAPTVPSVPAVPAATVVAVPKEPDTTV